jgi:hypothetical protein
MTTLVVQVIRATDPETVTVELASAVKSVAAQGELREADANRDRQGRLDRQDVSGDPVSGVAVTRPTTLACPTYCVLFSCLIQLRTPGVRSKAMFVRIARDQAVSLHEVSELQRLHVEVAVLDERALQSAVQRHGLGQVHDEGDIDLRVATLRQLAGDQDEQWVAAFADMLGYAQSKGWMPDAEHVRAHCVHVPLDQ